MSADPILNHDADDIDILIKWMRKHTERCFTCTSALEGPRGGRAWLCPKAEKHGKLFWLVVGAYRNQRTTLARSAKP